MKTYRHSISLTVKSILILMVIPLLASSQKLKYGERFPSPNGTFEISVIHDERSKMLLPIGAYRVPNTSYVFFSPKTRTPFFGVVGVLVDDHASTKKMKGRASDEAVFGAINLDTITAQSLKANLHSPSNHVLVSKAGEKNVLKVRPCAWIVITDNNYELTFELEAYFLSDNGSKTWKGMYGYTVPEAKPLFGDSSITANNGELLNDVAQLGLNRCIEALLADIKGIYVHIELPQALGEAPKGSVLLTETENEWVIKQPLPYKQGSCVKIVGKTSDRLLPHPVIKNNQAKTGK